MRTKDQLCSADMLLEEDGTSSTVPERAQDHVSFRGKIQSHQNSWQTEECLNPVRGIRDWQKRNGIEPHNHHRDNITAIRAQSMANRLGRLKAAEAAALPAFTAQPTTKRLATPAPKRGDSAGSRDFVYQNALATKVASVTAKERRHTADEDEGKRWLRRQDFGQIPSYLQARKVQLAEQHEEAQKKKLDELVPPGMRVMPEEERLGMLDLLTVSKKDVEGRIQALPFVIETVGQKQRAAELHKRLAEVEEAMALFSRKTVLVQL